MDFSQAKAESIGHLGLIAATLQDFGVMDKVDQQMEIAIIKKAFPRQLSESRNFMKE